MSRYGRQSCSGQEPAELLPLFSDPAKLTQILLNLLGNALKFTRQCEQAVVEAGGSVEAGEACFFVRDNGAGFDMAFADRLFRPFSRLHRAEEYPGTGIGLAVCQRIVERHGGRIWFESEPGNGTTFFFTVPK